MTKKAILLLATATLVFFSLLGILISDLFGPAPMSQILQEGKPWYYQLAIGGIAGWILGVIAWAFVCTPYLQGTRNFFSNLIKPWNLSWWEILFISGCAGIGEEVLFRGAVQPLLGVGWTSLVFVALHGYLNPFNRPLFLYGLFMLAAIALIGYMALYWGLLAAIIAHAIIDVILLYRLSHQG